MLVASAVDNNLSYDVSFGESSDFNKTNRLEVHQRYVSNRDYRYYVVHNGREIHSKFTRMPHNFTMSNVGLHGFMKLLVMPTFQVLRSQISCNSSYNFNVIHS